MIQEVKLSRIEYIMICLVLLGIMYLYIGAAFNAAPITQPAQPIHQYYLELLGDSTISGRYVVASGQDLGKFLGNFEFLDKKIKAKYQYVEINRSKTIKIGQNQIMNR